MRKITKVLGMYVIPVFLLVFIRGYSSPATIQGPSTHAQSAALIDVTSGRILKQGMENSKELPIASFDQNHLRRS